MQHKTFLFENRTIHYDVYGEGKPVMLLHGFAEDSSVWQPQINFLQAHFRLVIPDIPGSGRSELVPGANIETYAEVIKAICDLELQTGETLLSFIGHSMGGYIMLAFAEKYPELLQSIGLFHSSAFADTEEKKQTRKKAIGFMQEKGAGLFLKTSIPDLFTKEYNESHAGKVNQLIEKGNNFSTEALKQYYEAMIARPERISVLKNFDGPVLFIIGEHDKAIPMQAGLQQCHLPAQSHVHILSKSAHMGMWEEEERSNNILLNFLLLQES